MTVFPAPVSWLWLTASKLSPLPIALRLEFVWGSNNGVRSYPTVKQMRCSANNKQCGGQTLEI